MLIGGIMIREAAFMMEFKNTFNALKLMSRPADTNQVSAGLFVLRSFQPTRPATLHSEFPKAREYNSNCEIRSLNALGDYQCLLKTMFTKRKSTGPCSTMG